MKNVLFYIFIIFFLVFYSGCLRETDGLTLKKGVLMVGIEIGYPPMEYYDDNGNPAGFDISLANAIGEKLDLKIEFIDTAWDGIFAGVDAKRYDCIISSVTITPERIINYNVSKPYIQNTLAIVLPRNSRRRVSSPSDLGGLGVAFQEATTSEYIMADLAKEGLRFTPYAYDKVMYCFDELRLGRVDAIMTDIVVAYEYLARSDFYEIVWQGGKEEFGIIIKKDNNNLFNAVNNAISELLEDGTMLKFSEEHFNGMDLVSALKR
ncbi:MAG: transporter substrate-binding domain-containing protein [Treponema sp.]|jgi:polar amino acid transport system substrate-binding protein|nr:transporter substrate-binding domain-containing protein [Treponema sp.]